MYGIALTSLGIGGLLRRLGQLVRSYAVFPTDLYVDGVLLYEHQGARSVYWEVLQSCSEYCYINFTTRGK